MSNDNSATPMTDADIIPPAADAGFETAAPIKDTADTFGGTEGGTLHGKTAEASQAIKDGASNFTAQAADKARFFAEDGKAKAGNALDQFATMLTDAAAQVDSTIGAQYGQYARTAATAVSDFSEQLKAKDVDALVDDARGYVRASPAIAIGAAAALGFVVARLVQSGIDSNKA